MEYQKTKPITRTKKVTLKDGTIKEYTTVGTYTIKGYVNANGTVNKFSDEQKQEMRRLHKLGVPIAKIARDFNASRITITKIVRE